MKITRLSLWHVPLTSHKTYIMADGKTCDTVDSVILRVDTDDKNISGWGESCPIPHYLPAYAHGIAPALTEMAPAIIGADPVGVGVVMAQADGWLQGHLYAKSALDMALWDITGKTAGLPLYSLIGGRRGQDLPLYHSITCIAPDDMVKIALDAKDQGIEQFQVKLGADKNWQADVERLVKVREAVGPGPNVYGDWNCSATRLDAIRVGRAVSHLDIMLEQPCPTLDECAGVRAATGLPMKLDELVYDTASLLEGHRLGIMDAVSLKTAKLGGVSAMRRARDLCLYLGAKMCIEDTWGSDIATAALLHIGISTEPRLVMNVCDLSGYVKPRLDAGAPSRKRGRIAPPDGSGLGVTPDAAMLGKPDVVLD